MLACWNVEAVPPWFRRHQPVVRQHNNRAITLYLQALGIMHPSLTRALFLALYRPHSKRYLGGESLG